MTGMVAPNSEATLSLTLSPPTAEQKGAKGKAQAPAQAFSSTVRIAITYPATSGRASPIGTVELPCARAFASRGGGSVGGSCAEGAMGRLEQHAQVQRATPRDTNDTDAGAGTARDERPASKKQKKQRAKDTKDADAGAAREEVLRMNVRVLDLKVGNGKQVADRKRVTVGYGESLIDGISIQHRVHVSFARSPIRPSAYSPRSSHPRPPYPTDPTTRYLSGPAKHINGQDLRPVVR